MTKSLQNLRPPIINLPGGTGNSSTSGTQRSGWHTAFLSLLLLLVTSLASAHVTEIRVSQAQDGSLTWYLSSYHGVSECGIQGSGLTINGVNYPLQSAHAGDISTLSPTVFASTGGARVSYAIVRTPFLGTSLSVQPYSTNVCWAFSVGGNGNFTPPPPPVCNSSPLTGWSNTFAAAGNNQGTSCNPNDDITTATIRVNHLACANITGDKQFRVVYDLAETNMSYGPFNYAAGVQTSVNIPVPYGTSNATQVKVIDDDFPAQITHGLAVPNGTYLGEKETVPPTLALPAAIQVPTGIGICGALVTYDAPVAADNCGAVTTLQKTGLPSGAVFPTGTTTNTFQTTDAAGNSTTASFTVTVTDSEAPAIATPGTRVINIPAGQSVNWAMYTFNFADPLPAGATVTGITLSYSGNDQGWGGTGAATRMHVSGTYIGGNQLFGYAQNFTLPYTGAVPGYVYGGNNYLRMDFDTYPGWVAYFRGGTMTIHYQDATLPALTAECTATVTAVPTANDNCAGPVRGTTTDPLTYSTPGTHVITWKFDDGNGNVSTATQQVIVKDVTAPTITAPVAVVVSTDAGMNTASNVSLGSPVSADNCHVAGITNNAPAVFPLGTTAVTWTVTDATGNQAVATQQVTVKDTEAPVPVVAALAVANGECAVTVTAPQAQDNTAGVISAATADALTYTAQGTYTITWTYSDAAGNTAVQTQQVVVKDVTAPTIAAPAPLAVSNDAGKCGAVVALQVPATADNCGVASVTNDAPAFFPIGTTTVTWTVTDVNGLTATTTQTVEVKDEEAPLAQAHNIVVSLDGNGAASITPAAVNNGSTDNCGIVTYSLSQLNFDCTHIGPNTVTLTVTDIHGNSSSATALVTVEDKVGPVVLTQDITVALSAAGQATITAAQIDNGSTDACGIATVVVNKTTFDCNQLGANTVTLTVTDIHGNVSTNAAVVTVKDVTAPVAKAKRLYFVTLKNGMATVTAEQLNEGSTDECGIASVTVSPAAFSCANIGLNTVTLTVTDRGGNVSTATTSVLVLGLTPVSSIQAVKCDHQHCNDKRCNHSRCEDRHCRDKHEDHDDDDHKKTAGTSLDKNTIYLGYGDQSLTLDATGGKGNGSVYAWTGTGMLSSKTSGKPEFAPTAPGVYTFTVVETNLFGCTASSSVTITVVDVRCGTKNDKVAICHKGQVTCVAPSAVAAHLAHGDKIGNCAPAASPNARFAADTDQAQELSLTAYPNPTSGVTSIEFTAMAEGRFSLALYDLKGSLLKNLAAGKTESNQFFSFELDVTAYPAGVFLVKLTTGQGVLTKRIVVQK